MLDSDRVLGTLLGTAVGDALGMPVDGLSHQNVRTYYKGIKGYRADEHLGDLGVGQWTAHTQRTFALVGSLTTGSIGAVGATQREPLRRANPAPDSSGAASAAAPLGAVWAAADRAWEPGKTGNVRLLDEVRGAFGAAFDGPALVAAFGQAVGIGKLLVAVPRLLDGPAFLDAVKEAAAWAEEQLGGVSPSPAERLRTLAGHLDDFPLDLQDLCDGTGDPADEAWPFAVAMFARNPTLTEATILPAINVGGAASAVGACVGALVGALHGWEAFPEAWQDELEDVDRLEDEAMRFVEALG